MGRCCICVLHQREGKRINCWHRMGLLHCVLLVLVRQRQGKQTDCWIAWGAAAYVYYIKDRVSRPSGAALAVQGYYVCIFKRAQARCAPPSHTRATPSKMSDSPARDTRSIYLTHTPHRQARCTPKSLAVRGGVPDALPKCKFLLGKR